MVSQWLKTLISLGLGCCIWAGIAPDFYYWYLNSDTTQWLRHLYTFLDGRSLVTVPICLTILYAFFLEVKRILADEDIRLNYIGVIAFFAILLNFKCDAIYPRIIGEIRFNDFFNVLFVLYFAVNAYRIANTLYDKYEDKLRPSKPTAKNIGFTVETPNENKVSQQVKNYGKVLTDQLLATIKLNNQSFAVGITGEWGSGKTTFLNLLRDNLRDKVEIVEFNPWMCQNPEQVTRDFFSSLQNQLSRHHSSLGKPISHYAKHLDKIRVSFIGGLWLEGANFFKTPSLFRLKSDLSSKFATLNKPVFIFIDDLDRLESKEVFEVLRLIRNTGDIQNTVYITAFDKEYVTNVIKERGVNDSSAYLEKIFPIELHLPKPETYQIWEVFKEEIKAQDNTGYRFAETLAGKLNNSDTDLILKILTNYRAAKRFGRLLMLNVNYLTRHYLKDFKYLDLFWLELLQFYDKHSYESLAKDSSKLLYYNSSTKRYILRNGILGSVSSKDSSKNYEGEKTWQPLSPSILNILFGEYIKVNTASISYAENYTKYFSLGLSAQKLSVNEFNHLLDGQHNYKEVVDDWIKQEKYISSIEHNILQVKLNALSDDALSNFLKGTLYYGLKKQSWQIGNLRFLSTLLEKSNFQNYRKAHDVVKEWMEGQLNIQSNLLPISAILKSLYATKEYDTENNNRIIFREKVITNDEIESLLQRIISTFLETNNAKVTPTDILNKETTLFKLFDNCCVVTDLSLFEFDYQYLQVSFDSVIEFFAIRENKPTVEEYDSLISALYKKPNSSPSNFENDDDQWQDLEVELYEGKMSEHFGSDYWKKLDEFKAKCFRQTTIVTSDVKAVDPIPKDKNSGDNTSSRIYV